MWPPSHALTYPPPVRRMVAPSVLARAIGWESRPRMIFRDGMYHLGPYRFPADILELPLAQAIALAKACCKIS